MLSPRVNFVVCALIATFATIAANAETVYLASSYETLYRVTPDRNTESFDFDVTLRGLHYDDATDDVYVITDPGGNGDATICMMENPAYGTPTLHEYSTLSRHYGSFTKIGGMFYGFSFGYLYQIDLSDPENPSETYIGNTGYGNSAGAAYNPDNDTLYMLSYATDALYTIDYTTADASYVGSLGVSALDFGAQWYEGQLYALVQNGTTDALELGTLSTLDGSFSLMMQIAENAASTATGLAIIPEPQMLGLMLVVGGALLRRRS